MLVQNFIKMRAAVHELSCAQRKNSDGNNTVRRCRADSNYNNSNSSSSSSSSNINEDDDSD